MLRAVVRIESRYCTFYFTDPRLLEALPGLALPGLGYLLTLSLEDLRALKPCSLFKQTQVTFISNIGKEHCEEDLLAGLRNLGFVCERSRLKYSIACLAGVLCKPQLHYYSPDELCKPDELDAVHDHPTREAPPLAFPFLFVSTTSGGIFLLVQSPERYHRLAGSIMGELTLRGMMGRMLGIEEERLPEAVGHAFQRGQSSRCDLLVRDIYGDSSLKVGLPQRLIASSMAKVGRQDCEYGKQDVVKSLVTATLINFAQLSSVLTKLHGATGVLFSAELLSHPAAQFIFQSLYAIFSGGKSVWFPRQQHLLALLGNLH